MRRRVGQFLARRWNKKPGALARYGGRTEHMKRMIRLVALAVSMLHAALALLVKFMERAG